MSKKSNKPFVLVDGSSYLFRAYHAMPGFSNSKGEPTGTVYGVINMIRRLLKDYDPEHIAVVFDAKGKTFRNDMFKEYKANRPPMPDDLRQQIEPVHEVIKAMGLPLLCVPGVEADDVIGTLSDQATAAGIDTVISTGDKDMAQLVNQHVSLVNTMTDVHMDIEGVKEKFGVSPERIIDYLALIGDTVDNVPGVPKVGPKTAVKWLELYDSLDGIMQHADEIKGKVGENLRDFMSQLPLSRDLVTIKCDVELEESPDSLTRQDPDNEKLTELYGHLEFKTWLAEAKASGNTSNSDNSAFAKKTEQEVKDITANYETIFSHKALDNWLKKLTQAECFSFDLETTSLDYMQAEIVGVSFSVKEGEAAYVPVGHDYLDAPVQLDRKDVLEKLKPLLEDKKVCKLGQNLKYDMNVLGNYDIQMQGIQHDTMLASYVLDSTLRHNMDDMAVRHLSYSTIHYEDVAGKGAKQLTFNQVDIDTAAPYAAEDADITLRLHQILYPQVQEVKSLEKVYSEIEIPLLPVLSRMERNGVLLDVNMLAKQSKQLTQRLKELELEIYEIAGEEFNIGSPKQLQVILFEKLELPIISKTPKGQPSTAESVLQELAHDYPLPKLILEYRSLSKLKSTYTDKLPKQVEPKTGRVHTSYHQAVAATGRLSSSDPNLQNIPIRTEEGRRIRQAFVAAPGYKMVAADYSQIELRIMAHLSSDKGLLDAFAKGLDVHSATAAEVFAVATADVTKDQRRSAKAINFGLIYGMSAFGLAKQLDITRPEAQQYVDLYFQRYPGVKNYMEQTKEKAKEQGYVETVFGRRLYLHEINARNGMRRQYAERTAINAPMQGTAADIIKRAMINLDKEIQSGDLDMHMIMQVHDELIFEIKESQVEQAIKLIRDKMESAAELDVPLVVDVGIGMNWDEAH
ncbi:MAG: DNA polymerase I [Gammaproteobacteria bacterium]|nr:DNA polymerase I [Gammaproteobacteria bacterium]